MNWTHVPRFLELKNSWIERRSKPGIRAAIAASTPAWRSESDVRPHNEYRQLYINRMPHQRRGKKDSSQLEPGATVETYVPRFSCAPSPRASSCSRAPSSQRQQKQPRHQLQERLRRSPLSLSQTSSARGKVRERRCFFRLWRGYSKRKTERRKEGRGLGVMKLMLLHHSAHSLSSDCLLFPKRVFFPFTISEFAFRARLAAFKTMAAEEDIVLAFRRNIDIDVSSDFARRCK